MYAVDSGAPRDLPPTNDGPSLFGRSETQIVGGPPGWRGHFVRVGAAVPCQLGVGEGDIGRNGADRRGGRVGGAGEEEDIGGKGGDRRDGASAGCGAGTPEPGDGGGGGVFGGAGRKPAGPHPGEAPGGLGAGLGDRGRGDATVDCAEANGTAF